MSGGAGRATPRRKPTRSAAAPVVAALACACAGGERAPSAPDGVTVTVDTVGGVPRVVNAGTAPAWGLETIITLGSAGAVGDPTPDEFGSVTSVALGPDGALYVADARNHEVRVFDMGGRLVRSFGREGQGPGELVGLYSLAFVGDTLLTMDTHQGRIGEWTADGRWLGQRRIQGGVTGSPSMIRFYPVGPDEVYAWTLRVQPGTDNRLQRAWVRHSAAGEVGDVAHAPAPPPSQMGSGIVCRHGDGISFFDVPFAPRHVQHPAPGGLVAVAWTADPRVGILGPEGDTARVVEREVGTVPVGDEEWERGTADFRRFREEVPSATCEPREPSRPATKPAIADLLVDVEGRLWVETWTGEGKAWEVFGPEGRLLGSVPSFDRSERTAPFLGSERVAWVFQDSLGVERVRVAGLVR